MCGPAERLYADPFKSLVCHRDIEIGWLGDDGRVGAPKGSQRFGAKTRVLFVNNGGNNEAAARADILLGNLLRRRTMRSWRRYW